MCDADQKIWEGKDGNNLMETIWRKQSDGNGNKKKIRNKLWNQGSGHFHFMELASRTRRNLRRTFFKTGGDWWLSPMRRKFLFGCVGEKGKMLRRKHFLFDNNGRSGFENTFFEKTFFEKTFFGENIFFSTTTAAQVSNNPTATLPCALCSSSNNRWY